MIDHKSSGCTKDNCQCGAQPSNIFDTLHRRSMVLADIEIERIRQDQKWGEQNHKDGTHVFNVRQAHYFRDRCDRKARTGDVTWLDLLLEEVWEAAAEISPAKLREELIQVAAVATAWVEAIDRRTT